MKIEQNAFYILNVSCRASAGEMADAYKRVRAEDPELADTINKRLSDPQQRLEEECNWFPGVDSANITLVRACVEHHEKLQTGRYHGIDRLNALIYNLQMEDILTVDTLCWHTIALIRQYNYVRYIDLQKRLNEIHILVKAQAVSKEDIHRMFEAKQNEINLLIVRKTAGLTPDEHIQYAAKVLSSVKPQQMKTDWLVQGIIQRYEAFAKRPIQTGGDRIDEIRREMIKGAGSKMDMPKLVTDCIRQLDSWRKYTVPLESVISATGEDRLKIRENVSLLLVTCDYLCDTKPSQEVVAMLGAVKACCAKWAGILDGVYKPERQMARKQEWQSSPQASAAAPAWDVPQRLAQNVPRKQAPAAAPAAPRQTAPAAASAQSAPQKQAPAAAPAAPRRTAPAAAPAQSTPQKQAPAAAPAAPRQTAFAAAPAQSTPQKQAPAAAPAAPRQTASAAAPAQSTPQKQAPAAAPAAPRQTAPAVTPTQSAQPKPAPAAAPTQRTSPKQTTGVSQQTGQSGGNISLSDWHVVTVRGDRWVAPSVCTCCMGQATQYEMIGDIRMPVCKECLSHRTRERKTVFGIAVLSIFCGAWIFVAAYLSIYDHALGLAILCGLISALIFCFLTISRTSRPLPSNHATRNSSVLITPGDVRRRTDTRFHFASAEYAKMFVRLNPDTAKMAEEKGIMYPQRESRTLWQMMEHKRAAVLSVAGIVLLLSMCIVRLDEDGVFKLSSVSGAPGTQQTATAGPVASAVPTSKAAATGTPLPQYLNRSLVGFGADASRTAAPTAKRTTAPTARRTAKPTSVPTAKPKRNIANGTMLITPDYEQTCPFRVKLPDSSQDYYIYLKYIGAPTYSTKTRQPINKSLSKREGDVAFYVTAGNEYKIMVPIGQYKLYYATGYSFEDTSTLFGSDTSCFSSDEILSFYCTTEGYEGYVITLKPVTNGNFDTDPISKSQFPIR